LYGISTVGEAGRVTDRSLFAALGWAAGTRLSLAGNAVPAFVHTHSDPILAASVAIVPPIALLTAVLGVTVLLRAQSQSRSLHRVATSMTALIAAAAFWLSFTALRSLAELAGIPHQQIWLWPLIIEGAMTQATIALIALTRAQHTPAPNPSTPLPTAPHADDRAPTAQNDEDAEPPEPVCASNPVISGWSRRARSVTATPPVAAIPTTLSKS
jgi:hypothetical protein